MKIWTPATSANLGPGFDAMGMALSMGNQVEIEESEYGSVSYTHLDVYKRQGHDRVVVIQIFFPPYGLEKLLRGNHAALMFA